MFHVKNFHVRKLHVEKFHVKKLHVETFHVKKLDLLMLAEALEKKIGKRVIFHKLWDVLKGKKKLSQRTLDRLALLAGFQSWEDFQGALHGTEDGLINYCADQDKPSKKETLPRS